MIPTNSKWMEKFLQDQRFSMVKPYLNGDVLDFGGNQGELKQHVKGRYLCINYDHSPMEGQSFDTIVSLATIEHLEVLSVYDLFSKFRTMLKPNGTIFITTPTRLSKGILETMASINLTDKANIDEHKHYWNQQDLQALAKATNLELADYRQFQLGLNQIAIFKVKQ